MVPRRGGERIITSSCAKLCLRRGGELQSAFLKSSAKRDDRHRMKGMRASLRHMSGSIVEKPSGRRNGDWREVRVMIYRGDKQDARR